MMGFGHREFSGDGDQRFDGVVGQWVREGPGVGSDVLLIPFGGVCGKGSTDRMRDRV